MDPSQNKFPAPERIRWDDDEEAGKKARPTLRRGLSTDSLAVHSIRSRRNSIDAAAALPVQYRTVSIDIDDYNKQQGQQKKVNAATTEVAQLDWHTLSPEEILRRLSSSRTEGLSPDQVARRMAHYGKNAPSDPPTHHTRKFLGYFFKGFGPILLVAAILVFIAWRPLGKPPAPANLALAIVLLAVFFIQAAFNMWQDWSSSRVMASIKTMLPDHCLVTRDGAQLTLLAEEIVPGDILTIKMGNKLPADVRFIGASSDARFDRSILTGTSFSSRTDPRLQSVLTVGFLSDYINPIDLCNRLNTYIIPEAAVHGFMTFLFLINGYWLPLILNLPLLAWNVKKIAENTHLLDATEIFRKLNVHKKESFVKLGFHLLLFFFYLYSMIVALIRDDTK
ncbi:Sodium/potassium-transporting ATPase subunit alpha-1 like protein [Verticillium longisporum]|nr:Sodium/potassium-transporting ATPase subunit alpha-1 like protein [Verticillium longisporum]